MINRNQALTLVKKYLNDTNIIRSSLAVEVILRKLAKRLDEDEELWGITGLLHNIDYEFTRDEQHRRGVLSTQLLDGLLPEEGVNAIKANNYINTEYLPETSLDKALITTEAVVCLILHIMKTTTGKLFDVEKKILIEKYKDESFANHCNKNRIKLCNDNEISIEDFLDFCLKSLQESKDDLTL